MRIEILKGNDIRNAVSLSRYVYDIEVRYKQGDERYDRYFDEYMDEQNIQNLVQSGQLTIWGMTDNNQLVAVSGMNNQGLITMLYVHPGYVRRKCGMKLIEQMRYYAAHTYGFEWVDVNALPYWSSTYFQKRGFSIISDNPCQTSAFTTLRIKSNKYEIYQTRTIPAGTLALVISIFLCLIVGSSFGYMFYFLL